MKTVEKDFETVEKEVTKYKCDAEGCENIVEENEINTVALKTGDHTDTEIMRHPDKKIHACETCTNLRSAVQIREEKKSKTEYFREWWSETKVWTLLILPSFLIGMSTMFFVHRFGSMGSEPILIVDLFLSFVVQIGIALVAFVVTMLIFEYQGKV